MLELPRVYWDSRVIEEQNSELREIVRREENPDGESEKDKAFILQNAGVS